ncbi:MAG: hypothetical protein ACOCYC_02475 [bacterium]
MNAMQLRPCESIEFYAPFAHVPGVYEACRIHTVEYGSFDTAIAINRGTDRPVTVYVNSTEGERFMTERFPESLCIRVDADALTITASPDGRSVRLSLTASAGPLRRAELAFTSLPGASAQAAPYGDASFPVWGSRFSCRGIDLNLPARAVGHVTRQVPGPHGDSDPAVAHEAVDREATVALGSMGILAPLESTYHEAC